MFVVVVVEVSDADFERALPVTMLLAPEVQGFLNGVTRMHQSFLLNYPELRSFY